MFIYAIPQLYTKDNLRLVFSYLAKFIAELHRVFARLHINYLEINPLVVCPDPQGNLQVHILDVAAKFDQCAEYLFSSSKDWSVGGEPITFPPAFGQTQTPEVSSISTKNVDLVYCHSY